MSKTDIVKVDSLKNLLQADTNLELAILVGSRALDAATQHSDWDIAIRWKKEINGLARLEYTEVLKQKLLMSLLTIKIRLI